MKIKRHKKKIALVLALLLVLAIFSLFICDRVIKNATVAKMYNEVDSIPFNHVGLLLGTGKFLGNGAVNPYYSNRIEAAAALYRAGKIKYLVVSGDNGRREYDEPTAMRTDLMTAGVDSTAIYLDYAGFRTFDSIVRLKKIFGQDRATIISQPFHNQRAIYIANRKGIAAIGFNARDVGNDVGWRVQWREKLARVKVFIDFITGKEPKFLGEKVVIPAS